ncbi:dihydrofolate reductase family protein [uncultured Cellulomonas sp.]|uniref:dihydrofolate reductase family protein n=1 Tax=uncultured Cellulomonas sp. TaxID=189682 RepID=UPI00262EAC60|nr:dihydrofolate reductase family protein [uncultured Cellulomonas sp.]
MRTVSTALFHSVDGVVESPHLWQLDAFDDELGAAMNAALAEIDTVLLGRVTYEQWASYWPDNDTDDFGAFINPVDKLVASRTLQGDLAWKNSRLIDGDLVESVSALKRTEGGTISVCGSISVVRQLLFAGVLDSLMLMTHPVVAGSGRHLFEPGDPLTRLALVDVYRTSAGNVVSTYARRGS